RGMQAGDPALGDWQAGQVSGGQLREAHIDAVEAVARGGLRDDAGLADARRPPDHRAVRNPMRDEIIEIRRKLAWCHRGSFVALETTTETDIAGEAPDRPAAPRGAKLGRARGRREELRARAWWC